MRFTLKPDPKPGDIKVISRFLYIPYTIGHDMRWLEYAHYEAKLVSDGWDDRYWVGIRWLD